MVMIRLSCKDPIVVSGISSINMRAMQAFKYIIHGDDHCHWSLCLFNIIYQCPESVLVKYHVRKRLYFEQLMAAYRQFFPNGLFGDEQNANFDNLVDRILWTKENENVANRICK